MVDQKPKYLIFKGDPNNKPLQLLLTATVLGKGEYGTVQYAFNRDDPSDGYAVKCIDRKKIQTEKD